MSLENEIREIVRQEMAAAFASITGKAEIVSTPTTPTVQPIKVKIAKIAKVKVVRTAVKFAPADPLPSTSLYSVGQKVSYKQGRGTFEAEVSGFDGPKVLVKRLSDGKVSGRLPSVLKVA